MDWVTLLFPVHKNQINTRTGTGAQERPEAVYARAGLKF
ncbi:hypothetical protein C4K02_3843 [Pseudomonas synxantha]|nr:hypothetical protein C4K02_3843 [Pseudomonas synxantha]